MENKNLSRHENCLVRSCCVRGSHFVQRGKRVGSQGVVVITLSKGGCVNSKQGEESLTCGVLFLVVERVDMN